MSPGPPLNNDYFIKLFFSHQIVFKINQNIFILFQSLKKKPKKGRFTDTYHHIVYQRTRICHQ